MAKIPTNKIKKAVKIAYLGQRPLLKTLFKTTIPMWAKSPEAERAALLKVGAAAFGNALLSAEEANSLLGAEVPAPAAGGLVEAFLSGKMFAVSVFLNTTKEVLAEL